MTLDEAKAFLTTCFRDTCVDHSFGDEEVSWFDKDGQHVAEGYFSDRRGSGSVSIRATATQKKAAQFEGNDARAMRRMGELRSATRNDTQD